MESSIIIIYIPLFIYIIYIYKYNFYNRIVWNHYPLQVLPAVLQADLFQTSRRVFRQAGDRLLQDLNPPLSSGGEIIETHDRWIAGGKQQIWIWGVLINKTVLVWDFRYDDFQLLSYLSRSIRQVRASR